jgi:tetratricopeptide (TPR) repeat protein
MSSHEVVPASEQPAPVTGGSQKRATPSAVAWRFVTIAGVLLIVVFAIWHFWIQPYRWQRQAVRDIQSGRLDNARSLLEQAIHRRPNDAQSRLRLCQLLDIAGETDRAVQHLYRLPEDVRSREDVLINLGRLLVSLKRPAEAEGELRRCVQLYPQSVRSRQLLLDLYRWQHRDEEGLAIRHELAILARDMSIADQLWVLLRSFIEEYSKIEDQENWEQLIHWWEKDNNDVQVRIAMARHLILQGDRVEQAASELESLRQASPDSVAAIASLLEFHLNIAGSPVEVAEELLDAWPEAYRFHTYWRYRGLLLEKKDDENGTIAAFRKALALRPDDRVSLQRLSTLLAKVGRDSAEQPTIEEAKSLAERLARVATTQSLSGELLQKMLQWLTAWDASMQGLEQSPDPEVLREFAAFYEQLGRETESRQWREAYDKACSDSRRAFPTDPVQAASRTR